MIETKKVSKPSLNIMPERKCNKEISRKTRANKRIVIPLSLDKYVSIVNDTVAFRQVVDEMIRVHPELFPAEASQGYYLHDQRQSAKMDEIALRRIKMKEADAVTGKQEVYTVAPSGLLPYLSGETDVVEKALFLRRFGVPFWGLTYVFGRDDQYWYRLTAQFGRYDIVSTTVKTEGAMPDDLLADEKHAHWHGERVYIATTVGSDCVLGAAISPAADTPHLTDAYGIFAEEATQRKPDYAPATVNTDGWAPTQSAWRTLFSAVVIIECFLHAFINIRARSRKKWEAVWPDMQQMVWDIYHAPNKATFQERVLAFHCWAHQTVTGTALAAIDKLCARADRFILAFDYPTAYRTSAMLDRHMEPMARWLFSCRFFHGHLAAAEKQVRAWSLLHNFWPYCPRAKIREQFTSPAHRLNGFVYHENWLHNLLVSTSLSRVNIIDHKIREN
jgi:hypothetical protein